MKKTTIHINDSAIFVLAATFLDQPDIIRFISKIRKRLNLTSLISYTDFDIEYRHLTLALSKRDLDHQQSVTDRLETLNRLHWKSKQEELEEKNLLEDTSNWADSKYFLNKAINEKLDEFAHGPEFRQVLLKAIVCGVIEKSDYLGRPSRQRADHIVRDREWYWINGKQDSKLGYRAIARDKELNPERLNWQSIKSAIKSYEDRINTFPRKT